MEQPRPVQTGLCVRTGTTGEGHYAGHLLRLSAHSARHRPQARSSAGSGAEASLQSPWCAVPEEARLESGPGFPACAPGPALRAGRGGQHCLPEKPGPSQGSWQEGSAGLSGGRGAITWTRGF